MTSNPHPIDRSERPDIRRRVAAVSALLLVFVVFVVSAINIANDAVRSLVILLSIVAALFGAWYAITRVGGRRLIAIVFTVGALVVMMLVALFAGDTGIVLSAAARVVLLIVAAWLARFSISLDLRSLKERETPGLPVPAAKHGALIMNLKSGGGNRP